jgi:hypothetical protein
VYTQYLHVNAAVRFALATGDTLAANEIRLHGTQVTDLHSGYTIAESDDFNSQFVAEDAGIGKKRLSPPKSVVIGTANANTMHLHKRFARPRRFRGGQSSRDETAWFFECESLH